MTNKQLKNLKDRLWESADQLRANSGLKSNEYATPILGLIFLRFAQSKYSKFEASINAEYEKIRDKMSDYLPRFFSATANIINRNYKEPPATSSTEDVPF